jgi:hypothetical protein
VCSGLFAAQTGGWWPLAIVAVVAGFTQNALGILMHEASHYFLARDRQRNDRLANWLLCYPLMNTVAGYRAEHFLHQSMAGPVPPLTTTSRTLGLHHKPTTASVMSAFSSTRAACIADSKCASKRELDGFSPNRWRLRKSQRY